MGVADDSAGVAGDKHHQMAAIELIYVVGQCKAKGYSICHDVQKAQGWLCGLTKMVFQVSFAHDSR